MISRKTVISAENLDKYEEVVQHTTVPYGTHNRPKFVSYHKTDCYSIQASNWPEPEQPVLQTQGNYRTSMKLSGVSASEEVIVGRGGGKQTASVNAK